MLNSYNGKVGLRAWNNWLKLIKAIKPLTKATVIANGIYKEEVEPNKFWAHLNISQKNHTNK